MMGDLNSLFQVHYSRGLGPSVTGGKDREFSNEEQTIESSCARRTRGPGICAQAGTLGLVGR